MIIHMITEGLIVRINVNLQIIDRNIGMLGVSAYWTFFSFPVSEAVPTI